MSLARVARRWVHASASARKASKFVMPAMSPTMTEGGIASWKKKEGEAFSAGDVLLEIETDKATIDVEAQDDGVLAKILAPEGTKNVQVGKLIAVLAEPDDDLGALEMPKDDDGGGGAEPAPAPTPKSDAPKPEPPRRPSEPAPAKHSERPTLSKPAFPSVLRLLQENALSAADAEKIKGTGVRGMLTKGDVLAHLGRASSPTGTFREAPRELGKAAPPPEKTFDGPAIRRLIVESLAQRARGPVPTGTPPPSFASVLADYSPIRGPAPILTDVLPTPLPPAPTSKTKGAADFLDGLV